jgi:hypothetical protein
MHLRKGKIFGQNRNGQQIERIIREGGKIRHK